MGNYTIFLKFENPRRGRQARNFSENDPKILDLKSSSEQIIFRKLSLGAPALYLRAIFRVHGGAYFRNFRVFHCIPVYRFVSQRKKQVVIEQTLIS